MKNKNPLVSIVIPVFNGSNYLKEAVDSALAQTYKNIEVIVVNDGSNDGGKTRDIAISYGDKLRYYEKGNGGVASALNMAIREMKGEFFSWLSHDDVYYPNKIEKQIEYYLTLNDDKSIVFSNEEIIDSDGRIIKESADFTELCEKIVFNLFLNPFIGGCSLLIPKMAFTECGYFNETLKCTQDYEMWFRMIKAGYSLKYLPIISGQSRIHPNQVSKKMNLLQIKEDNIFRLWVLENFSPEELWGKGDDDYNNYMILYDNYKKKGWLLKASFAAKNKALRINNNIFKRYLNYVEYFINYYLVHCIIIFIKKFFKFIIRRDWFVKI
jgi:glycosyltransferase involved in cell wall biosynthesis